MSNPLEFLASLKVGTEVALRSTYWRTRGACPIRKITRMTPTQVVVGRDHYRKKDGRRVGGNPGGYITEPSDVDREGQRLDAIVTQIKIMPNWRDVDPAKLDAVALAMGWSQAPYFTDDERAEPISYGSMPTGINFRCARRDLGAEICVDTRGFSDSQLATAVMEFTMWWGEEVLPRLNGFGGWTSVVWRIDR